MHAHWVTRLAGGASALALATAIAFTPCVAGATYTATIFDALQFPDDGKTYSHGYATASGSQAGWRDSFNVDGDDFFSGNIYVTWSGSDVILQLETNMPSGGSPTTGQRRYGFADIFISTNGSHGTQANPTWDYGIDFNSGPIDLDGGFGQVTTGATDDPTIKTVTTSNNLGSGTSARLVKLDPDKAKDEIGYAVNGQVRYTNICSDLGGGGTDCENNDERRPEVEVIGGTILNTFDVGRGENPNSPPTDIVTVTLSNVNTNGEWNDLRIFWATGWCANDTVEGYAVVPIPAALPMLLAAIGGLGLAGWRQRRRAA